MSKFIPATIRVLSLFILLLWSVQLNAQKKYVGDYHTFFGNRIEIYGDSTFKYLFSLDTESSWTKGIWKVSKDTVYFTINPVYDTVVYRGNAHTVKIDSLIFQPTKLQSELLLWKVLVVI